MSKLSFCHSFVYLQKKLITFGRRPYLPAIYAARSISSTISKTSRAR